jgi:hypothetical protein
MRHAGLTLAVELEHLDRDGIERLEPCDVVANIFDQHRVARGMGTMRFVDQHASIGRAIEWRRRLSPGRGKDLIVAEHCPPRRTRVRRLDQGISEIAKLAFVVGQLELRRARADACGGLGADKAVHVVVAKIVAAAPKIAAAAGAERRTNEQEQDRRKAPDRKMRARHGDDFSGDGGDDRALCPLPGRCRRSFRRSRARSEPPGGSGRSPCRPGEQRWLSPAVATRHPPEIQ